MAATARKARASGQAQQASAKVFRLHRKQGLAFASPANEILYGGAAGGGKSHLMRVAAISWCRAIPGLQVYLFRRQFPDLMKNHMEGADGFPSLLADWVKAKQCRILFGNEPKIEFANGSKIHLCHCQLPKHVYNYQGAEIHVLMIDELTHFLAPMYNFLRGRVRLGGLNIPPQYSGMFPRILCGANPGGVGHAWVKIAFVDNAPPLEIVQMPEEEGGMLRQYIPANLNDNPTLVKNDPNYRKRLAGLGDAALVRAMLDGDWDIVSGGMFDDLWKREIHVVEPFTIPASWRIDRSFDWGSSKPFSVGWWAESDGTDVTFPDGSKRSTRRGDLYRIAEWYGWNNKANEGLKMLAKDVAKGIVEREKAMGIHDRVKPGPADSSIYDEENGNCIAKDMEKAGVKWVHADKSPGSRKHGWEAIRKRLDAARKPMSERDEPGLWVFKTCTQFVRTVPVLPRDQNKPDDVDSDAEDHCFAAGTLVNTEFGLVPIEDLVGKTGKVYSVDGNLHEFHDCRMTRRVADVVTVTFSDGRSVICTPDHRFLTVDGRWVEALYMSDEISYSLISHDEGKSWSSPLSATQFRNSWAFGITYAAITFRKMVFAFIASSGPISTAPSQMDLTSITRTPTRPIMIHRILSYCWRKTTTAYMGLRTLTGCLKACLAPGKLPAHGMVATKVNSGTVSNTSGIADQRSCVENNATVNTVEKNSQRHMGQSFAQTPASLRLGDCLVLISSDAPASSVDLNSQSTAITAPGHAAENALESCLVVSVKAAGKADVYCLDVPEMHCFAIEGGIIVHNCADESRYRVYTTRKAASNLKITGF